MDKPNRFEHVTETLVDGSKLQRTVENKAPSPRCCLCGVKLILNEVEKHMCIKCSSLESSSKPNNKEEEEPETTCKPSNSPSSQQSNSDRWSMLESF